MKFNKLIAFSMIAFMFASCAHQRPATPSMLMPTAINEINAVGLSELNLKHGADYTVVNTITAEAVIIYSTQRKGEQITIKEGEHDEFKMVYRYDSENGKWYFHDYEGIARFGFFSNEAWDVENDRNPALVAIRLVTYRLVNKAKVSGADGVIEPVYSTSVEDRGKEIVFKTTASAKLIKLKTDAK